MLGLGDQPEVASKEQMILKFAGGSQRNMEESDKRPRSISSTPFGDIGCDRRRRPSRLGPQSERLRGWEPRRDIVHSQSQFV